MELAGDSSVALLDDGDVPWSRVVGGAFDPDGGGGSLLVRMGFCTDEFRYDYEPAAWLGVGCTGGVRIERPKSDTGCSAFPLCHVLGCPSPCATLLVTSQGAAADGSVLLLASAGADVEGWGAACAGLALAGSDVAVPLPQVMLGASAPWNGARVELPQTFDAFRATLQTVDVTAGVARFSERVVVSVP